MPSLALEEGFSVSGYCPQECLWGRWLPPREAPGLAQWRLWCVLDPLVPDQQGGILKGSPEQVRFPPHTDLVLKERKG